VHEPVPALRAIVQATVFPALIVTVPVGTLPNTSCTVAATRSACSCQGCLKSF
jgi:hypothetical protein